MFDDPLGSVKRSMIALFTLGFAPAAHGQQPPACGEGTPGRDGAECEPVEVVVVGTRTPESVQRSTVRTGVVTREEAETRGARNVAEALAGEPSLQVNPEAYGFLGRPSGAQIQGLDADRVLVLEDGEPVVGDRGGVVDLAGLPLADVERVEYVMGPTSSLYGSNALGGVVNVVTAPPREGPSARGRVEARDRGSWLGEGSFALRRSEHWVAADASGAFEPALASEGSSLLPERTTRLLGLRGGTSIGSRIELRLRARWVHDELFGTSSESVPGLGVYRVDLPERSDRLTLRVQESVRLGSGARLELSLAKARFTGSTARNRRDSPLDERRERRLDSQSGEATLTLADGASRTWVVGLRSETEQFSQELARVELDGTELRTVRLAEVGQMELASGAAFGQLAWLPAQTLTVLGGARAEVHDRYGVVIAPRLAVALRPSDAVAMRAAIGRGFRAPSAKEFGFAFDHSALGYRVLGNADLEPERSWGLNGDASIRPIASLQLRAGGFANRVSDLIALDLAADRSGSGVDDYTYVNVARAYTAGADGFVRWTPETAWSAELGYAYLWTRDDSTGRPLSYRPQHTLTAAAGANIGRARATIRYRVVSSAFVEDAPRAPSYALLDVRVGYRVWREIEAYAGAFNVLDVHKDFERAGDARPALGRAFALGVRGELPGDEELDDAVR